MLSIKTAHTYYYYNNVSCVRKRRASDNYGREGAMFHKLRKIK